MRTIAIIITIMLLTGCARREEPPQAPTVSPGPPRYWDVGSRLLKSPLPEDVADGYLEFARAPGFSYGVALAHQRLSARSHERSDMLIYIHRGSARFHAGEKDYSASTGDVIFIPRGAIYDAASTTDQPLELLTVYCPPLDRNDVVYHERAERDRKEVSPLPEGEAGAGSAESR